MHAINNFKALKIMRTYSNLELDLVDEVVVPLLERSVLYDRGVGFFTSGWLKEAVKGLLKFVKNNGKARIITSVNLAEHDWEIIKNADKERHEELTIKKTIDNAISDLKNKIDNDTLAALAWLIRDEILEFRFAVPAKNLRGGIFHSKISLFYDSQGNGIALHGSQNDSVQASINEESFSAFCSWDKGEQWFVEHKDRFNQIWENRYPNLRTLKIKDAEKEIIIRHTEYLPRPYLSPKQPDKQSEVIKKKPDYKLGITLRDYQNKAITKWENQGRQGIFEMATGTGKTITSISAAINVYKFEGRLALIILVPYIHLVDQWVEELHEFGFQPTRCYESSDLWKNKAAIQIREYNAKLSSNICLVTTHKTASMPTFIKSLSRLHAPYLLIGDEVHELGSGSYRKALTQQATWRIGLSATPDRWYDEEGTHILRDYFGNTVIKYELKEAIKDGALTPYHYYPEKIDLNEEEIEEYLRLSKMIAQLQCNKNDNKSKIEGLLRKRADLIGRADDKIPHLLKILNQHKQDAVANNERFQHILIYCNKGTHKEVLSSVAKTGLKVHEFVHDVPLRERKKILDAFSNGEIDGLIAIRCLDQGVDIPATRRAYILASSTNPREFVQRRGRILRKSTGKNYAIVHDFIVGPWGTVDYYTDESAKTLLLRELPRFAEFSLDARNAQESRDTIWTSIEKLDLIKSLRKRPWDVYKDIINKID